MALHQRAPYETADRKQLADDEVDRDADALAQDYDEQVHYDGSELGRTASYSGSISGPQDIQLQLQAAAQPLDFGASLEQKFQSYDSYCNLFHFILNSDGPVDLDVPTVCSLIAQLMNSSTMLTGWYLVLLGMGCYR